MPAYCVVIRGPLGIGKSTISSIVAERIQGLYISVDKILEEEELEIWDADRISLTSFLRVNQFVARLIDEGLTIGRPAVVDGNFYWREQIEDLLGSVRTDFFVFTLEAPLEVCIARDKTRPAAKSGLDPSAGDQHGEQAARDVYALSTSVPCGIPVDATGTVGQTVQAIMNHLPRPAPP